MTTMAGAWQQAGKAGKAGMALEQSPTAYITIHKQEAESTRG